MNARDLLLRLQTMAPGETLDFPLRLTPMSPPLPADEMRVITGMILDLIAEKKPKMVIKPSSAVSRQDDLENNFAAFVRRGVPSIHIESPSNGFPKSQTTRLINAVSRVVKVEGCATVFTSNHPVLDSSFVLLTKAQPTQALPVPAANPILAPSPLSAQRSQLEFFFKQAMAVAQKTPLNLAQELIARRNRKEAAAVPDAAIKFQFKQSKIKKRKESGRPTSPLSPCLEEANRENIQPTYLEIAARNAKRISASN